MLETNEEGVISVEQQVALNEAHLKASQLIRQTINNTLTGVQREMARRAYRVSNELRNSSLFVLRGKRSGKVYKLPGTHGSSQTAATKKLAKHYGHKLRGGQLYRASAPGEPPAVRTGAFRLSWGTRVRLEESGKQYRAISSIESHERAGGKLLGEMLENGHGHTAARPYKQQVITRAMPKIRQIYDRPYNV